MTQPMIQQQPAQVYRIDKFQVPAAAQTEFLQKVQTTHALLKTLPGFQQDLILVQTGGPGSFNIVTLVVWENAAALQAARPVVMASQQASGFDPHALFERLGIQADLANYAQLEADYATY